MEGSKKSLSVEELYDRWPYPKYSLLELGLSRLDRAELPLLNYESCYDGVFGGLAKAAKHPKVLVVGCGTFEAIAVRRANPEAEILAIDISDQALKKFRQAKKMFRISKKIETAKMNFFDLHEQFDFIIATGVLHHLEDPASGFCHLHSLLTKRGVARLMVYSSIGRSYLYEMKKYFSLLGADQPRKIRDLINKMPKDHPYKIYFHLYSDARNDNGVADGFLHPVDHPFTALELKEVLDKAKLRFGMSLQSHMEVPKEIQNILDQKSYWEKMQILDATSFLRENFRFLVRREEDKETIKYNQFTWNPILKKTKKKLYSRILGKNLYVNTSSCLEDFDASELHDLTKAKFLLRA